MRIGGELHYRFSLLSPANLGSKLGELSVRSRARKASVNLVARTFPLLLTHNSTHSSTCLPRRHVIESAGELPMLRLTSFFWYNKSQKGAIYYLPPTAYSREVPTAVVSSRSASFDPLLSSPALLEFSICCYKTATYRRFFVLC